MSHTFGFNSINSNTRIILNKDLAGQREDLGGRREGLVAKGKTLVAKGNTLVAKEKNKRKIG